MELVRNPKYVGSQVVLLIDESGTNLGETDTRKALQLAKERGLDLILVSRNSNPPVCKIGNLGLIKYQEKKNKKENRVKTLDVKTLKIRPHTASRDLDLEVKQATKFLAEGHKVRIECRFRNRELSHPEIGKAKLEYILLRLEGLYKIDNPMLTEGKSMSILISSK